MKNDFKINIIHYISTLTADEIKQMIYNFHQVLTFHIAIDKLALNFFRRAREIVRQEQLPESIACAHYDN